MKNVNRCGARAGICLAAMTGALVVSAIASPAAADSVRWRTIIGIAQAANVVGNIGGGGQPWATLGGRAKVDLAKSRVDFEVEGLVLAGGNTIGTPAAVNQVMGTIVCDAGLAGQQVRDTPPVTLSPQGDAEFSGATTVPIPTTCNPSNVVFLVRIPAGRWIANGSVRTTLKAE